MAQDFGQLTDEWMVNPTMFDPTQASNQFSNFNNAPFPFPPTYNTGAGGPVNAGTGQPIQSFQQWQQANPGGMSINATPAAPAAPQSNIPQYFYSPGGQGTGGAAGGENAMGSGGVPGGQNVQGSWQVNPAYAMQQQRMAAQQAAPQAAPQASGPPNNWMAALNALSNPGNPKTPGATVPLVQGYQPSGGVNQSFLNQAVARGMPGMNRNFLSALSAVQNRPQQ